MNRLRCIFPLVVLASLPSANLYGQEPKKPSPAVKKILDEAVRDVKKNRQEFDKANQKPLDGARSALEELSRQLTKEGKTKEAIAALQQVETLERDVMAMVSGGKPTLSPGLKEILDQAVLGVMANRQALQKANETPLSEARSALEELAKKQTKDGKTNEAITTLQQVDTLERDVFALAGTPAPVPKREKIPAKVANPAQQGAVAWNGHKYLPVRNACRWIEAKKACEDMGGHLLIVETLEEQNALVAMLARAGMGRDSFWIGATDEAQEGIWRWVDGSPVALNNWNPREPNNRGGEHYAEMAVGDGGRWNDLPLGHTRWFICEWDD